jgi:hypothetical protein
VKGGKSGQVFMACGHGVLLDSFVRLESLTCPLPRFGRISG